MNDDLAETIRTGVPWYKALGAHHVATILNRGANGLTRGGKLGIFTPMYFTVARKHLFLIWDTHKFPDTHKKR